MSHLYSNKILCFGEMLLRLTPENHDRLEQAANLQLYFDGAEGMVAAALAQQGDNVAFMTDISNNSIGKRAIMSLKGVGVDTSRVRSMPGRMGLFYLERGSAMRNSKVTYDRGGTPLALAHREEFDWDSLLNGVEAFYFSGVLPAVSQEMRLVCADALFACKGRGIKTYCDINYRRRMWAADEARELWDMLLPMVDVCVASDEDLWRIFPPEDECPNKSNTLHFISYYLDLGKRLVKDYELSKLAIEPRATSANGLGRWQGVLIGDDGSVSRSQIRQVADGEYPGCGDAFAAGVLHACQRRWGAQRTIEYALTASVLKSTISGSMSYTSEGEILEAMENVLPRIDH